MQKQAQEVNKLIAKDKYFRLIKSKSLNNIILCNKCNWGWSYSQKITGHFIHAKDCRNSNKTLPSERLIKVWKLYELTDRL